MTEQPIVAVACGSFMYLESQNVISSSLISHCASDFLSRKGRSMESFVSFLWCEGVEF